eukprot:TRINITY_DN12436_c0_g1_i1.p1 TRINITY_DN12436_c0_g1~~TRINITY_DN12436_c0_g1_i1.p1  ORF type:complete len:439 (+),score=77.92 TRINITY_DN12436_c0_g1_i1:73-1389(+)
MIAATMIVLSAVSADFNCAPYNILDCLSNINCDWNPSHNKCLNSCWSVTNQTLCTITPTCTWDGYCSPNESLKCENRSLGGCDGDLQCGVLLGHNLCQNCSSRSQEECGLRSCPWNEGECKAPATQCYFFQNQTSCNKADCIWSDKSCQVPDPTSILCQGSNTTNCIRWKYDLEACNSLTSPRECGLQATCEWNSYSETCEDTDICTNVNPVNCTDVGCTPVANGFCSSAHVFTKCALYSNEISCNSMRTCLFRPPVSNTTNGTCSPITGCNALSQTDCGKKTSLCTWNTSTTQCQPKGAMCSSVELTCGGGKCENLITNPDMSTYSLEGTFFNGQTVVSMQAGGIVKNGVPCYNCQPCEPGFVMNVAANIYCGSSGTARFNQQICVRVGEYDDGSSLAAGIIVVIIIGALIFVAIVIGGGCKVVRKKGAHSDYEHVQ